LLNVPADKTTILGWGINKLVATSPVLPPQEHNAGDNYQPEPYQLDPNDDDMSRLQDFDVTYEYREEREERDDSQRLNLDREQNYYAERDRRDYEQYEREYERGYDRLEDFYEYASRSSYHN
jgi:hypothetical protein